MEFAAYKLEGGANTWWKQTKRLEHGGDLSWDKFKELFYDRYFPQGYRDQKVAEFYRLQQGDMSVREYEAKFNELARFAPSAVASEREKCIKFQEGLKVPIRRQLVALRLRSFGELVSSAISVENDYVQHCEDRAKASGGPQRSGRKSTSSHPAPGKGKQGGATSGSSSSSGSGRSNPYSFHCHFCQQPGHIKRNCPIRSARLGSQTGEDASRPSQPQPQTLPPPPQYPQLQYP